MADRLSPMLSASAEVAVSDPLALMGKLCDHFVEHGSVERATGRSVIRTSFGNARLEALPRSLRLLAEGRDDTALAFVKMSLAEHLIHFAGDEALRIVWEGDGPAGAPLPYFREMTVAGARQITPHMRRLILRGPDLGRFAIGGHHVRLLLPKEASGGGPVWPVTGADGRPEWPQGAARPELRVYTIRRIDVAAGEVEIDFVLHEEASPGSDFARHARIGQRVGMMGPGGGETPEAEWLLLAGDETALPAIARMLGELPSSARVIVRIEVTDASEEQALPSRAGIDLRWLHRNGAAPGTTTLIEEAVREADIPEGSRRFVWVGCEHRNARAIRGWLRGQGLVRGEHLVMAYWRRGRSGDAARAEEG